MQKFQLSFQTYLLHVQGIGVGTVCAGLSLLENLSQNICHGTDLILGLVGPNSSVGVAYPYTQGALSIQFTPRGCSVSPVVPEADRVDELHVLAMEKQVQVSSWRKPRAVWWFPPSPEGSIRCCGQETSRWTSECSLGQVTRQHGPSLRAGLLLRAQKTYRQKVFLCMFSRFCW